MAAVCLLSTVGCINGGESNSAEPVVTTPSESPSSNGAAVAASPGASNSLSVVDSSYNADSMRIDTIRK